MIDRRRRIERGHDQLVWVSSMWTVLASAVLLQQCLFQDAELDVLERDGIAVILEGDVAGLGHAV